MADKKTKSQKIINLFSLENKEILVVYEKMSFFWLMGLKIFKDYPS